MQHSTGPNAHKQTGPRAHSCTCQSLRVWQLAVHPRKTGYAP